MPDRISIEGPVELVKGQLILRIPLNAGGDQLAPFARGIGNIDGECLNVVIPPWLAEKLRIGAGSLVVVDNQHGKFTITRSPANDAPRQPPPDMDAIRGNLDAAERKSNAVRFKHGW